jgi:hypothetical protein
MDAGASERCHRGSATACRDCPAHPIPAAGEGRDITGLFAVIVDRPGDAVCLLGQRHRYAVTQS